jgi:hypothetical protein
MQPALAVAVDLGLTNADAAWSKYQGRNPKQDYSSAPQFAVTPKSGSGLGIGSKPISRSARASRGIRLRFQPGDGGLHIQVGEGREARFFDLQGVGLQRKEKNPGSTK